MLKILINNEEVVCDKQLEIKEEMLSTSSCILNNCYPKSWENTKDYTSQYYYPKDYSKCVIKDEVNIPPEEGEYATGTNLNINVDNTKEWDYQLEGDTQQNTSILPSGYTQVDYIYSINNSYIDTGYKPNENTHIKMKFNSGSDVVRPFGVIDGTIGYNNNTGYWRIFSRGGNLVEPFGIYNYEIIGNKVYREGILIYTGGTSVSLNYNLYLCGLNDNGNVNYGRNCIVYYCKIYDNNVLVRDFIPCYRNSDNVVGMYDLVNDVFYTNQGTGAFTYGSVVDIPNPDYPQNVEVVTGEQNIQITGKNLIKFSNIAEATVNGITYSIQDDVISLNGTATGNIRYLYASDFSFNGAGDYRITLIPISGNYTTGVIGISSRNEDKTQQIVWQQVASGAMSNKKTYTAENISQIKNIGFYINSGSILNNLKFKFMFTKGDNIPTTFEPYQSQNYPINLGNIELCKIGDYQDYIYNQNGDWYLHKEIYKYIVTGNETFNNTYGTNLFGINGVFHSTPFVTGYGLSTYYVYNPIQSGINANTTNGEFALQYQNGNCNLFFKNTSFNNPTDFKNDVLQKYNNGNPIIIMFPLQNPTDTQITDTTLIQQLDNLKNETLYNGVNNISVSGDLPSILNLHYNFVTARTDTKLLFSGVVKNTGNINLNPRYPHYCSLEVLDFKTFLSECDQLDFVINNKTITEAIEQVTQAVSSYGFVVGNININDDTIIGAYSTQEKTPYDVFQYLADISQSRWYTRLVDENTVAIDFYDPTAMQRGIDLDFSNNTFACQNNVEDLSFNYGTYDYRNKQIMLSNQVFGGVDFEETIVADGYNKIFNTTTPIGILKGITVNGSSATFATNEDKEMGVEADFYYNPGQTQIESNENDGTYPTNTIIVVGYTPLVKGRQVISDTTEISRIATQTGRNGTISRYEKRNDVLSSDELELIGNSYLKYKGTPEINLTVVTKDVDLYNIGQIVYFNYPNIEDLSKDYMVKSKRTKIINTATDWNIWYTYTLTSNFNSENAINYFDNQRAKASGNIKAGDYITRNVDIENSCMIIFSNPIATEITIADNNILNAPLNAPFTQ